jgi:hypothetical protein
MKYTKKKPKPCLIALVVIIICLCGCQGTEQGTVAPIIKDAATAVTNTPLPADNTAAILETVRVVNAATSPLNPYSPFIEVGLAIATILTSFIAKKKSDEAAASDLKYKSMKQGTESFKVNNPTVAPALYAAIGDARAVLGVK